jgi:hypothetical protein
VGELSSERGCGDGGEKRRVLSLHLVSFREATPFLPEGVGGEEVSGEEEESASRNR